MQERVESVRIECNRVESSETESRWIQVAVARGRMKSCVNDFRSQDVAV